MRRLFPLLMLFALAALLTGCEEKKNTGSAFPNAARTTGA